jgi:hypothetical protein
VQARQPGAQQFATVSTGRSSSAGVFRAVYRPTTAGVWAYRLLIRASTTARMAISPARIVTVTPPTTTPPTTTPPTTTPPPTTPANIAPGPVTGLTVVSKTSSTITLAWTNPTAPDFAGVMIRRAVGATPPASPTDGALVTKTGASDTSFIDSGLNANIKFAYALFAFDTAANFSSEATGSTTTGAPTTAVLTINDSTDPTAKLTQGDRQDFAVGGSAGLGLFLLGGTLDYGDGTSQSFTGGDPAFWIPNVHQYTVRQGQSALFPAATWRVFDSAGNSDLTTIDITVFKDEPTAKINATTGGKATAGVGVIFDVTTGTPVGSSITSYDFYSVNQDTNVMTGDFAVTTPVPAQRTLTFVDAGTYDVTLVVDNDAGGDATYTVTVHVVAP